MNFSKEGAPVTWLFYGASVSQGAFHTHGWRGYSEIFAERVRFEMNRPLDVVLNNSFSGYTSGQLLEHFNRCVQPFKPQVVFLMIGMNDCSSPRNVSPETFANNLRELCARISDLGGIPVLQTPNYLLPGADPDRLANFPKYREVIVSLAKETQSFLIDHWGEWEGCGDNASYWMSDGLHPNQYGHLFFAHTVFQALGIYDEENSSVCRQYLPSREKICPALTGRI